MKMYDIIVARNLSFSYAKRYIEEHRGYTFISRPEWDGFHFIDKDGRWCIYTKEGKVMTDVPLQAVQKQGEKDWMIVKPSYFTLNDLDDLLDWDNM